MFNMKNIKYLMEGLLEQNLGKIMRRKNKNTDKIFSRIKSHTLKLMIRLPYYCEK